MTRAVSLIIGNRELRSSGAHDAAARVCFRLKLIPRIVRRIFTSRERGSFLSHEEQTSSPQFSLKEISLLESAALGSHNLVSMKKDGSSGTSSSASRSCASDSESERGNMGKETGKTEHARGERVQESVLS